ncbi:MAG: polyprenyl synthetase family protein [Verrucomicrobia bacterium]|nr:polyprenyl synthetase family protein [Verrucomicrobiota bacterium]
MRRLESVLDRQCDIFEAGVATCVRYVTGNQGKRLRPALVIFSANAESGAAIGAVDEDLLRLCAIVEMVHIATLVHDDIMDGAKLRRNRLTAGAKWGNEVSVLLGDSLFAHALTLAASYPTPFVCRRVAEATNIVCSGEILQTQRRFDLKLKESDYLKMIEMKTGALFAVACELGAHLAGASDERRRQFYQYGRLLGIAYQIYDDCLDLVGAEKDIGKSLGTDLQKGKLTLPVIHLLQQAKESETHLISSILLNEHANSRAMLMEFIQRYNTLGQAAQRARALVREAASQLQLLPDNEGRRCLEKLTAYLDAEMDLLR